MILKAPTEGTTCRDAVDARLDAIFAEVRRCSAHDFRQRIHTLHLLLEKERDIETLEAVKRMDLLIERLRSLGSRSRGEVYRQARAHLLSAWRQIMRGDYSQARRFVELAEDRCRDMA